MLQKLSSSIAGVESPYGYFKAFARRTTESGTERLVTTAPQGKSTVVEALLATLEAPFLLLYILHTPRSDEAEPGRYRSPELSAAEVLAFLHRFGTYLQADARFDLWFHSPQSKATLVWDRHNQVYAYGPLDAYEAALTALGFTEGEPELRIPHVHHYRAECDADAAAVMGAFAWRYSALRPEDEQ